MPGAGEFDKMKAQKDALEAAVKRIADSQPEPMLQFFAYAHLPPHLQAVSKPFSMLATNIVTVLPRNAERTVALRKLLESKDCAVRSLLYVENNQAVRPTPTPPQPPGHGIETIPPPEEGLPANHV